MKKLSLLTIVLASLAFVCSCTPKQEPPQSTDNVQQADEQKTDDVPQNDISAKTEAAAPATAVPSDTPAEPVPTVAAKPSSDEDIFKYTINTNIATKDNDIKILVKIITKNGKDPVRYDLDCEGDGEFEYHGLTGNQKCIYKKNSGKHQIWMRGEIPAISLCFRAKNVQDEIDHSKSAIISIDSWGNIPWKSMQGFATECKALKKIPNDSPDLRQVKSMGLMFGGATSFNQPIEHWDVSNVTNMMLMFTGATSFNQPLEKWNVSNVKDMHRMFFGAKAFSYYPKSWVVPENDLEEMFKDTKVEKLAKKSPLQTKIVPQARF